MSLIRLPIYEGYRPTRTAVEAAERIDRDSLEVAGLGERGRDCHRCKLGDRVGMRSPCLAAEGVPGGLLVIGEGPGGDEDAVGRPFAGKSGRLLRSAVAQHWRGPVAYDNALRCFPGRGVKIAPKMINECRGFLAQTLDEVQPTRIITVGAWAAMGVFGRSVSPFGARGGYGHLRGKKQPIPVFMVLHPAAALRNRFVRKWWEHDIAHALTAPDPPYGPWDAEATVVTNQKIANFAVQDLARNRWVSFDVETQGTMWNPDFDIISVALCGSDSDEVWVWDTRALEDQAMLHPLLQFLQSKRMAKIGQNVKYDQLAFRARYGITIRPIVIDTRLQRKLLDPEADAGLAKMAELIGMGGLKEEAENFMSSTKRKIQSAFRKKTPEAQNAAIDALQLPKHVEAAVRLHADLDYYKYGLMPFELLTRYNARDALATKKLGLHMEEQIKQVQPLQRMWEKQVLPASSALERVEGWGVSVSKKSIQAFDTFLETRETIAHATLAKYSPPGMNWNAPAQIAKLFFTDLRLPVIRQTDSGAPSTDAESLKHLAQISDHPLPKALLEHRFITKMRGTYAQGLFAHIRADGRIHPNLKLDGARSGRLSCVDPNLQNIPRAQSDEGKMARDCFTAPKDYLLLEADYSQLELRVAAMLSGDKVMLDIFNSGTDYHLRTAQLISKIAWGIAPEAVTDKHRSLAKSVNFGVLYGKTAHTFSKEWGIAKHKAQQIVDAIMGQFKMLQRWCNEREAEAAKTGEVWTWWAGQKARRRPLFRIADPDDATASVARNGAKNSPIQGTATDYCTASLVQCVDWIEGDGIEDLCKLVLAVHDSLMFEVHKSMVKETVLQVQQIMTSHDSMGVPLIADFKVGPAWGSLVKIKPGQDYTDVLAA